MYLQRVLKCIFEPKSPIILRHSTNLKSALDELADFN